MPNVIEITSFSAPELDVYARLTENQLVNRADPSNALFIAESPNVIDRALNAGCVPVSMLLAEREMAGEITAETVFENIYSINTTSMTGENVMQKVYYPD